MADEPLKADRVAALPRQFVDGVNFVRSAISDDADSLANQLGEVVQLASGGDCAEVGYVLPAIVLDRDAFSDEPSHQFILSEGQRTLEKVGDRFEVQEPTHLVEVEQRRGTQLFPA